MRSLLIPIFAVLMSLPVWAFELDTQVHDVEVSVRPDEPSLVFLASGHVAKLSSGNKFLSFFLEAKVSGDWVRIALDNDREITHFEIIDDPEEEETSIDDKTTALVEPPTVLNSMDLAQRLFRQAKYNPKESQCFSRAHVWSYEWKKFNYVNTSKLFIFFTPRYIREHDFHWWFHVAPLVHVAIGPDVKERVMDRKYLKGPSSIRTWIDTFMEKGSRCRTVKAYSEYANYPEAGDCYLMRANMFTYWPLDLELEELKGTRKTSWMREDLKAAYLDALGIELKE